MRLQVLDSIRSERQFAEQISHKLLYRWFVSLATDDVALRALIERLYGPVR